MKKLILFLLAGMPLLSEAQLYKDPKAAVDERVKDLLKRMTLDEKISQMQMNSFDGYLKNKVNYGVVESPFTNVKAIAGQSHQVKKYARERTRLGIPPIQIGECLHGQLAFGATIFPQAIGQGSTWNPALIEQMGNVIAYEASASGVDQALSPLFDLARDPRFGRVEECFAEDPYLVSQMGKAFVIGMQGPADQSRIGILPNKIMCTAKHFAGYSVPLGGINLAASAIGERDMRTLHLKPFEVVVKEANIYSVMPSYNEVDGVPAHANIWLLDKVLRKEWNFQGYVFSDYGGLSMQCDFHKTAANRPEAALSALKAGVDLEAPRPDVYNHLKKMIEEGALEESLIDTAVKRILSVKFKAGLFEKPYPDTLKLTGKVRTNPHIELAGKIAEESVVLLKNEGKLLPLKAGKIKSLAVIGPNANQVQYGDYSYTRDNTSGVTILEGIEKLVGKQVKVNYAKGCDITGTDKTGFDEAIAAANKSDVVILVVGESSAVLSGLGWGVGLGDNEPKDPFTGGEGYDVTALNPPGVQRELIKAIHATGKPVILVMVHGRPWSIDWEKDHLPALIEAWYPGEQGGTAVANILFGKVNPSGRLNVSFPRSVGHIPVTYDYKPGGRGFYHKSGTVNAPGRDYVFSSPEPLFPFGYGLSYTDFSYSNMKVSHDIFSKEDEIVITVDVKNTGSVEGKEVVQLYINDKISSVTTPAIALKGFEKVSLKPSETKNISFKLNYKDLGLWNKDMEFITEPGEFEIIVGRSAIDPLLTKGIQFK